MKRRIEATTATFIHIIRTVMSKSENVKNFDYENSDMDYYDVIKKYAKEEMTATIEINNVDENDVDVDLYVDGIRIYLDSFNNTALALDAAERLLENISKYNYIIPTINKTIEN